jgi:hypothetical protein
MSVDLADAEEMLKRAREAMDSAELEPLTRENLKRMLSVVVVRKRGRPL